MWKRLTAWQRGWEEELIARLQAPAASDTVPPALRRIFGSRWGKWSPIERRQLLEFLLKYRGRRLYVALAKLIVLFTLGGILLHLLAPKVPLPLAIFLLNMSGLAFVASFLAAYFSYRMLVGKGLVIVLALAFCGSSVGYFMGAHAAARDRGISMSDMLKDRWLRALLIGTAAGMACMAPVGAIAMFRNNEYHKLVAQLELDTERERSARELSESRLRLLHAQIEPHFLFNTLGAVQQLAEDGAPRAASLTAHLIDFLRASMSEMRSETVALKADFAMIEAYLQVMQVRMGERLRYRLTLPAALEAVLVPSMLLLTLVENAIKHGIEPSVRGGEIQVAARAEGGQLRLAVSDNGVGLASGPAAGGGMGLENVRSRLQLQFAAAASLTIGDGPDGGVVAEIAIPMNQNKDAR